MYLSCAKRSWLSKKATQKAAQLSKETVKNICVIKYGALGDMVLTRPMLITLRKEFPNAKITLAVIENYMRGIPEDLIDELHVTKKKGCSLKETLANLKSLEKQDILFDITETSRSMWLSLFTKATLKIGYIHKGGHRFFYDVAIHRAHNRFEAETFAEQLNVIGLSVEWPLKFNLKKPEKVINKPYIVYFPTASNIAKSWPWHNFVELIKYSTNKYPNYLHIVLSGIADWEIDIAKNIMENINSTNLKMYPGGKDMESVIANTNLLVSNDTGIRNMAIAYYTPTIGIVTPNTAVAYGYQPHFGYHKIVHPTNNKVATVKSLISELDNFFTCKKMETNG